MGAEACPTIPTLIQGPGSSWKCVAVAEIAAAVAILPWPDITRHTSSDLNILKGLGLEY